MTNDNRFGALRSCVSALAAIVHENASTAMEVHSLSLHVAVAEDAIHRWPNNPELSCLSCWVLRSVVDPPSRSAARRGFEKCAHSVIEEGVSSAVGSVVSYESTQSIYGEGGGGAVSGGAKAAPSENTEGFQQAGSNLPEGGDGVADDFRGRNLVPGASMAGAGDGNMSRSEGSTSQGGSGSGCKAIFEGSTANVFGTGDKETSDLLISLDDGHDGDERLFAAAGKSEDVRLSGTANAGVPTAEEALVFRPMTEDTTNSSDLTPENRLLLGIQTQKDPQLFPQDGPVIRKTAIDSGGMAAEAGIVGAVAAGVADADEDAVFEGERDADTLERLLQLAEATKVQYLC